MVSAAAEQPRESAVVHARGVWVAVAVGAIVALDQLTKSWAVAAASDRPVHIIGDTIEFRVARNSGSAFSRFQGLTPILAIAAVVVAIVLVRAARRATDRVMLVGLVLVLGGALGNLVDRFVRSPGFLRGRVVDFVKLGWWPLFNVADSCITIGAILLVVRAVFPPEHAARG